MGRTEAKKYIDLIFAFIKHDLDGSEFVRKFFEMWKADRDEQWALNKSPRETASREQLSKELRDQLDPNSRFTEALDQVFTACDAFNADPEEEWELDEERLRSTVAELLESWLLATL